MSTFTGKQRILMAFDHKKSDRLPVFDVVNKPDMYTNILGMDNFYAKGIPAVRLALKIGMDAVLVHCAPYTCLVQPQQTWDGPDTFTDRFGIKSKMMDGSWPLGMAINPIEPDENFLKLIQDMPVTDADVQEVRSAVIEAKDRIAVFGGARSAFSFLMIALGLENLSVLIYDDPDLLESLVAAADAYWTKVGLKLIEAGCTALYVADDMGMNQTTLISPSMLRKFFIPSLKKQVSIWKEAGGRVVLHSCGNINAILDDISLMGIDALTNLQERAGMNLAAVKKTHGSDFAILGNVDATGVMTGNDKKAISEAIKHVISVAGDDGGLIIATDHSFHQGIPEENVLFFINEAKRLGSF